MEVFFPQNYKPEEIILIEIPSSLLNEITTQECIIKGSDRSIFCTQDKSFELKLLETTNTLIVLSEEQNETTKSLKVNSLTNHTLECNSIITEKNKIFIELTKNAALSYNLSTGESNIETLKKYSIEELFAMCDLCPKEFERILIEFNVFEKNSFFYVFNENFLLEFLKEILYLFSNSKNYLDFKNFTIDQIFSNFNTFNNFLTNEEKIIILSNISSKNEFNNYSLDKEKLLLFCSKNIFIENRNFKLKDFVDILKETIRLILPIEMVTQLNDEAFEYIETNCNDNLFPGFNDYDLRFLKGFAYVYFLKTQREGLISFVNVKYLSEKFEARLSELFGLKDRWTKEEIVHFFKDLEIKNLEERLLKYCRIVNEVNQYNNKGIGYLMLKFKI